MPDRLLAHLVQYPACDSGQHQLLQRKVKSKLYFAWNSERLGLLV